MTPRAPDERERFTRALDALVDRIRADRAVLAAILCGSLAHDTVWARSDIDLVLITIDDPRVESTGMAIDADGINVHAILYPRATFRRLAEGAIRNSFMHSLLAKGRLLYSHDESITAIVARLGELGDRDAQVLLLGAATGALSCLYKAHKWFITRADLDYTALWMLHAAEPLARIEVIGHGLLADREVLPQALTLNPVFFDLAYTRLLNEPKTRANVQATLEAMDAYVAARIPGFATPVIAYLIGAGEARSATELDAHFARTTGIGQVSGTCEYLADQGIIGKASIAARLTKKSTADVQELAFYALSPPPGDR
ncbi:MAG: hypothetical protein IT361_04215 [Gemmatimonadaceae bacterium]|nr:hypothetical protein [Gemmatimonadaceae bacterium]